MRDITWYNYSSWVYKPTYNILGGHATPCIHSIRHFLDSVNPRPQVIFCWMTTVIGCVLTRSPSLDMVILIDKIVIHLEKHRLYIYIDSKRCFILGCCSTHLLAKIVDVKQRQLFQSTHWHSACASLCCSSSTRLLPSCLRIRKSGKSLGKSWWTPQLGGLAHFWGVWIVSKAPAPSVTERLATRVTPWISSLLTTRVGSQHVHRSCGWIVCLLGLWGSLGSEFLHPLGHWRRCPTQKRPTQKPGSQNHYLVRI
jgi:hypothetical protein